MSETSKYPVRPALHYKDGTQVTTPARKSVSQALHNYMVEHVDEIAAVLAPYGVHPYDLARPEWEMVIYEDDVEFWTGEQA